MSRYQKGSVNNRWDREDERPLPPLTLTYTGADGTALLQNTYPTAETQLAHLAYGMAAASLVENPALLPKGTVAVTLARSGFTIATERLKPIERQAA